MGLVALWYHGGHSVTITLALLKLDSRTRNLVQWSDLMFWYITKSEKTIIMERCACENIAVLCMVSES